VDAFQKAHPNVTITMDAVADDPYKEKIRVVMASGQIPDIYFTWVGEYTRQFIRAGRVLDITKYLSGSEWQGRFAPATLDAYRTDGKLYGVPLNQDAKFMVYNKALFAKAGVSAPPTNWAEFSATLDKIKAAGIVPISFGSQLAWTTAHYIGDLNAKLVPMDVREADYRLTTPADKLFTDPGYVDALTRYQDFLTKGWFNKSPNALTHAVARASFYAGREAIMYQELIEFGRVPGTKLEQDGWDFFPMPAIPDGRGRQDMLTGAPDGFVVSPGCKHPDVAMAFLEFLTSKPEGAEFTRITHRTSATIGAVTAANAPPQALKGIEEIGKAKGLVLWLDTDVESRVASAFLAGGQALMGGKAMPAEVMAKVREAALAAQKERA
jgi:raffinose/stachyose/melibiose transport system substrate-binding protein